MAGYVWRNDQHEGLPLGRRLEGLVGHLYRSEVRTDVRASAVICKNGMNLSLCTTTAGKPFDHQKTHLHKDDYYAHVNIAWFVKYL